MTEPELEPSRRRRGRSRYERPPEAEPESPVKVTKLTPAEPGPPSRRALGPDGRLMTAESPEAAEQWDERLWRRSP